MKRLLDALATHVFGPLDRRREGDRSFQYVHEVEAFNRLPAEAMREHALQRIRKVCEVANRACPFYRARFKEAGITNPEAMTWEAFDRIPLLTRADIRDHMDDIINQEIGKENLRETATGGTTSAPITFFQDWESFYRRRSATIVFDRWYG
ncbi:MAG: hypothetical protein HKN21_15745, partial [Candidatus Eisenbacteria bacterium]|nr:hypothetical protein [Candidatus Eisenbacteria bacterium]